MIESEHNGAACFIGVDLGTTNTRVWLIHGAVAVERLTAEVGVRDTARTGNNTRLKSTLRSLIIQQQHRARERGLHPSFVIGAGMLTSALGLKEIPHISGTIGIEELRENVVTRIFPDVTDLPFLLIPGVKTGTAGRDPWEIGDTDVIRGEETLCVGLMTSRILRANSMLLNLGSHWKAILIGEDNRIDRCMTNLSGEMIFAIQTQTILADSVLSGRPDQLDASWIKHGIAEEQISGLTRALFCVRLLDLDARTNSRQRLSFLVGAFISDTLSYLTSMSMLKRHVVICGATGSACAWAVALREHGIDVEDHSEETEQLFIRGLIELSRAFTIV